MTVSRSGLLGLVLLFAGAGLAQDQEETAEFLEPAGDRVPVHTVVPVYPEKALRDRIQGQVEVCFNIDRDGRPLRIAVRKSTHRMFEKPAINAVRASSYKPLDDNEVLSGIKTCRTFRFQLDPVAIEDPSESSVDVEP